MSDLIHEIICQRQYKNTFVCKLITYHETLEGISEEKYKIEVDVLDITNIRKLHDYIIPNYQFCVMMGYNTKCDILDVPYGKELHCYEDRI